MGKTAPHLFPGRLHSSNRYAQHWGWNSLLAYGSYSYIVVVDPHSLRIVQTLDEHQANITCIRWAPKGSEIATFTSKPSRLHSVKPLLASGDADGHILLWDVLGASVCRYISEKNGAVVQMEWISSSHLAILFENGILILWNSQDNLIVWRKEFKQEEITYFAINPFDRNRSVLASHSGWIYFTTGITSEKGPNVVSKYRITPPASNANSRQQTTTKPPYALKQMIFSPSHRDIIYFILHKEILIFDLNVNLAVGSVNIDRGRSPFARIQLRRDEPDLMFCLHENGGISAWRLGKRSFKYELTSMWELQRFAKQNKKTSVSIYSILGGDHSHSELTMFANDGTVWVWSYRQVKEKSSFCITGLMETISSPITSLGIRWFRKGADYITSTITAIGTQSGTLQILNLKSNEIEKEFSIAGQPVRSVRWLNQHTVIAFSVEDLTGDDSGCWKNFIYIVDIRNGRCSRIRDDKGIEATYIRNIKVSTSRRYFVVLLRDRPFELWDAQSLSFLRTVKFPNDQQVSSFAWSPYIRQHSDTPGGISERFVVTTGPGQFHHFSVQKTIVSSLFSHSEQELAVITAIAWKDNFVVSGDVNGNIGIWDYETRKIRIIATSLKRVRGIRFSPSKSNHHALVIFKHGDFCIWDVENSTRLSNSNYLRNRGIKATEGGWLDESHPVIASSDGCIRVMDRSFTTVNSAFDLAYQERLAYLTKPLYNPYLLPGYQQALLRTILHHSCFDELERFPSNMPEVATQKLVIPQLSAMKDANDIPSCCLLVSKYFHDNEEVEFWTLTQRAFATFPSASGSAVLGQAENSQTLVENGNDQSIMNEIEIENKEERQVIQDVVENTTAPVLEEISLGEIKEEEPELLIPVPRQPLLPHFDLLRSREEIQREENQKAEAQRKDRPSQWHTRHNIDKFIRLDRKNDAVELLLETPPQEERYMNDALMACVIAAAESKEAFQSIVQSVASNLIAQNKLKEGIQLFLLIQNGLEACQHLQNAGKWDEAALLAKTHLPEDEMEKVLLRWCNELIQGQQFHKAALILLTLGLFYEVLQVLHEWGQPYLCMMFYRALIEKGLWQEENNSRIRAIQHISPSLLRESVYTDYGIYLMEISSQKTPHNQTLEDYVSRLDFDDCFKNLVQLKQ